MNNTDPEVQAIREIVRRQFASMTWKSGESPDLPAFKDDFLTGASLFPSARPLASTSIDQFCARMSKLAQTTLPSFHERIVGTKVIVFGNVAVAAVTCENTENERDVTRNVEMMLLVKDGGRWQIGAQAWDCETANRQIPPELSSEV